MRHLHILLFAAILSFTLQCSYKKPALRLEESNIKSSIFALSVINKDAAWASGSGGTILKTINGGNTWNSCNRPMDKALPFRGIYAFDSDTCVVMTVGTPAYIFKTCDGGKTWDIKYKNSNPDIFLNSITFWDRKRGIAVGDPCEGGFTVLVTKDQGDSWERIPVKNIPNPAEGEIEFAASNKCVSVAPKGHAWFCTGGADARVFHSHDWGRTWIVKETPIIKSSQLQGIFSITFNDTLSGLIAGGNYLKPDQKKATVAITSDGGETWNIPDALPPIGFCSSAAFIPGSRGESIVVTGLKGVAVSYDKAKSWKLINSNGYNVVSFVPDKPICWVAGNNGAIAKISF